MQTLLAVNLCWYNKHWPGPVFSHDIYYASYTSDKMENASGIGIYTQNLAYISKS